MNYYSHSIGDYRRDTMHLSFLEHGIYRHLLDSYYLDERPIPKETELVFRRFSIRTEEEKDAMRFILSEFFEETESGWVHKRCQAEIEAYKQRQSCAQTNGKLGGRPKKTQSVILGFENETQKKLTNNQEPITNNQEEEKVEKEKDAPTIPDSLLMHQPFMQAWMDYGIYRRKSKIKPLALMSQNALLKRLADYGPERATAALRQTIENGWQGVFEPKGIDVIPQRIPKPASKSLFADDEDVR